MRTTDVSCFAKNDILKPEFRAVHFILDHRIGGPHVYVRTLFAAFGTVVNSTLVTTGRGPMTEVALLNLRRWFRPLYAFEVPLNALLIMIRFGLFRRPSLFHVHGAANIAPLLAAFFCRVPVVWHFHETVTGQRTLACLGKWLVKHTPHRMVTVAASAREVFGLADAMLAPGAVDAKFWDPKLVDPIPISRVISRRSPLRLLAVANLNPLKGIDTLIDALPLTGLPIDLNIVGAELDTHANYAHTVKERAVEIAAAYPEITVCFLGKQSASSIRAYLSNCDVFVLPSRSEACPIALLEAMAMARPVIATDVGAVREILPAVQHIFICCPDSPLKLASTIAEMNKLPLNNLEKIAQENRIAIELNFTPAHLAVNLLKCYQLLLNGK